MRIGVNGRFLAARPTGVQRVAAQLVGRLVDRAAVTLRVPRGTRVPEPLRRGARVVEGRTRGPLWEQLELPRTTADGDIELDPANAGPIRGGRRVLVLHDVLPLSHPSAYAPAFRLWFRHVVGPAARRARAVVMFSEWARREAVRRLRLDPCRVHVIPQGVEPFDGPAAPELVRRTLDRLGIDRPFVLALGDGDPRKNTTFLEHVVGGLNGTALVLAGAGYRHVHARPATAAGAAAGERAGGGGAVVIRTGHVGDDELRALYTAARAFCFPSLAEGFGRPPLEAMACGTPVLAADYGSAREVLGRGATILPLEPAAWRTALGRLLADGAWRAEAADRGRRHAVALTWDDAVDALLDVCREAGSG